VSLRVWSHCGEQGVVVINLFNGLSTSVITLHIKLFCRSHQAKSLSIIYSMFMVRDKLEIEITERISKESLRW